MIGGDFGFEEALLLLLPARDLSAQRLNDINGFFKGLLRLRELIERAVCIASREQTFPDGFGFTDLPRKSGGALSEIQRLRMVTLSTVNLSQVAERSSTSGFVSDCLAYRQALLKALFRLFVVALIKVNIPDIVQRHGHSRVDSESLTDRQTLLVKLQRPRVVALLTIGGTHVVQSAGNAGFVSDGLPNRHAFLIEVQSLRVIAL